MNDTFTIVVGVTIANMITVLVAAYANSIFEKRAAVKRKETLEKFLDNLDATDFDDFKVKPLKKTAKRAVKKVEKDR